MENVIYKISNNINDKFYIGSAKYFNKRVNLHKHHLIKKTHHNPILQNFVNKYGFESLSFEIVEHCEELNLITREQYYIDTLKPYFNVNQIANSPKGLKRTKDQVQNIKNGRLANSGYKKGWNHSDDAKNKISLAHLGKVVSDSQRQKQSMAMKGKKHKAESIEKISTAMKNRIVKTETKEKLSLAKCEKLNPMYGKLGELHHNYGKTWKQKNPKTAKKVIDERTGLIYESPLDASKQLNINYKTIYKYLNGYISSVNYLKYAE